MRLRYWRNWWGVKCWFEMCGGQIDYDKKSTFWQCVDCGRIKR